MKQGAGSHIKRIENSLWCLDSKDSREVPMEEFVDSHEVAGFCNTYSVADKCNAKFITIGEEVFLVATRFIRRGGRFSPTTTTPKRKKLGPRSARLPVPPRSGVPSRKWAFRAVAELSPPD